MENLVFVKPEAISFVLGIILLLVFIVLILIYEIYRIREKYVEERRRRRVAEAMCAGYRNVLISDRLAARSEGIINYIKSEGSAEDGPLSDM